jgi:hypothetical protein
VFVSSTFSDLKAERNALQEKVFPRLRKMCAAHGCNFQAIDLRWGVSEEAALDQRTMRICLKEIERCHRCLDGHSGLPMDGASLWPRADRTRRGHAGGDRLRRSARTDTIVG